MIHPLLKDIGSLDFSNMELVRDFGSLFINCVNRLGWGLGTPIAAPIRSEMVRIGKMWFKGVDAAIEKQSAAYALTVYSAYDWIYRIVYNNPPSSEFSYRFVSRALDARIHGDYNIDVYELFRQINLRLMFNLELYKEKPLLWVSGMLDTWHKEFQTGRYKDTKSSGTLGSSRQKIADSDVLNRVAVLLDSNLRAFESDQKTFKKRLFNNHRYYIDDLLNGKSDYDTGTLLALSNFINASWNPFITQDERNTYIDATHAALYTKTSSPYLRASIELLRAGTVDPSEV